MLLKILIKVGIVALVIVTFSALFGNSSFESCNFSGCSEGGKGYPVTYFYSYYCHAGAFGCSINFFSTPAFIFDSAVIMLVLLALRFFFAKPKTDDYLKVKHME